MVCIYCGSSTKVTNSRTNDSYLRVWRRRMCTVCRNIVSTYERIDYSSSLTIKKAERQLEGFNRDKLFISIHKSMGHRKNAISECTAVTDTIIAKLVGIAKESGQVSREQVIEVCSNVLSRLDKASEVQYRAYHS